MGVKTVIFKMENVALLVGAILVAIGVGGYATAEVKSPTALIPAAIGVVFLIVGVLVTAKPATRKHSMHVAAMVALLGILAVGGRGVMSLSNMNLAKGISFGGTTLVLVVFLVLAIQSFIEVRRERERNARQEKAP